MNNQLDTQYSHNITVEETKQCTMCKKSELIKLPEEFQVYSRNRNYVSYFCKSCCQIVNFILNC